MAINAIHVSFKEPENLRLNFITLKKTLQLKKLKYVYIMDMNKIPLAIIH